MPRRPDNWIGRVRSLRVHRTVHASAASDRALDAIEATLIADVVRRLTADAEDAAVAISLRRPRLGAVRSDLPPAVVRDHARGAAAARTLRRRDRRARRCRALDRRAGQRQRRQARDARASARALAAIAPPASHRHLGRRARSGVAHGRSALRTCASSAAARRTRTDCAHCRALHAQRGRADAGAVSRVEHRQFRSPAAPASVAQHPRGARVPAIPAARRSISSSRSACCCSPTTIRSA